MYSWSERFPRPTPPEPSPARATEQSFLQAGLGVLIAATVCAILGWTIERLAYRPLRNSSRLSALITAIGISLLIENLANIEWRFAGQSWFGPTPTSFATIRGFQRSAFEVLGEWTQGRLGFGLPPGSSPSA